MSSVKILDVTTEHAHQFKVLIEVIKDILNDANLIFIKPKKKRKGSDEEDVEGCMKISAMDVTKSVLIDVKLKGNEFSSFHLEKDVISVGLNMPIFYKHIKSTDKNDILNLSILHNDKSYLRVKKDNKDELEETIDRINMLDIRKGEIIIPACQCDVQITIDAPKFHKICKDMASNVGECVEITCLREKLVLTCQGEVANRESILRCRDPNDEDSVGSVQIEFDKYFKGEIVQGIYELKHISSFSKLAAFSQKIEIYMKNDKPLIINYGVASLGRASLCLTPIKKSEPNMFNDEDESDDDSYSDPDIDVLDDEDDEDNFIML